MIDFTYVKPARHQDNPTRKLAALAKRLAERKAREAAKKQRRRK